MTAQPALFPEAVQPCKPAFQWIGGKAEMADWIIGHFPRHKTFVDCYGGAGGVILKKHPSPVEVYNDIDSSLVNFFRQCRDNPEELATAFLLTPYARAEFDACKETVSDGAPLEQARKFGTVARQSMAGHWGRAWSRVIGHSRRGMGSSNSRWLHLPADVLAIAARLSVVQIENLDALDCMKQYDTPDTLFYIDPPYLPETRDDKLYRHEMTLEQHAAMLECAYNLRGKVVVSGYANALYDGSLEGWKRIEAEVKCRSNVNSKGGTASRPMRTEVLWIKD